MKNFKLYRPEKLEEALALLPTSWRDRSDARPMAGGQDLLTEIKKALQEPEALVSLKRLKELEGIETLADGGLRIGAGTRLSVLESAELPPGFELLREAAHSIASPQIRTQATVGGNLCQRPRCLYYRNENAQCIKKGGFTCYAYSGNNKYNAIFGGGPSYIVHPSDLAPALVALEARVQLVSPEGERELPLAEFFTLPGEGSILRENVLAANELVRSVTVPAPPEGTRSTYLKFKERESYDWALSSVALVLTAGGADVERVRIVLGGVAPIPWRLEEAEAVLLEKGNGEEAWEAAAKKGLARAEPLWDNRYKVPLCRGLIKQALRHLARD